MKHHNLINDAPFEALDISPPKRLETTEDEAQLLQHLVSTFRLALNIYRKKYGNEARLELLTLMVALLDGIHEEHPEIPANYPDSLDDIYTLVGGLFISTADGTLTKKAG